MESIPIQFWMGLYAAVSILQPYVWASYTPYRICTKSYGNKTYLPTKHLQKEAIPVTNSRN
ncbi:hypothetical protein [Chitinophaga sp. LS1]|uniref:hypothetical protein n=1 Tax=Chitinophaga sp. LS1 TaxID=3051176 RepID=UPI002AAAC06A|nr:hypothetical protein [Chitinophaga sp. LS1]WPV67123.1 hypothetical protein QQL36_00090 [Chitinophaga sp. LS1]